MKKGAGIKLGLLAMLAGSLTGAPGCTKYNQTCVDDKNVVVDDKYCGGAAGGNATGTVSTGGYYGGHRWYYSHGYFPIGAAAVGGSFARPSSGRISTPHSASSRGIFGRFGKGGS